MSIQQRDLSSRFEIRSQSTAADGTTVLRLAGHLDADGAPLLTARLHQLLDAGVRQVDLDMLDVAFVSSVGIGTLIAAIGDFQELGGDLAVARLTQDVREVLQTLGLLDYVKER